MKKRNLIIAVFFLFVAIAFSSCKTHERCPAYGFNTHSQPTQMVKLVS